MLARWDPPWWFKVPVGIAVFVLILTWPILAVPVVVLCIPLIVVGVREKQRRRREGER
jgi:hypothetical protein